MFVFVEIQPLPDFFLANINYKNLSTKIANFPKLLKWLHIDIDRINISYKVVIYFKPIPKLRKDYVLIVSNLVHIK